MSPSILYEGSDRPGPGISWAAVKLQGPDPAVRDMAGCMAWVAGLDDAATMAAIVEHLRHFPYPEGIQPYLRSTADGAAQYHHHRRPDLARAVWENATTAGKWRGAVHVLGALLDAAVLGVLDDSCTSLCLARQRMPRSPPPFPRSSF